MTSTSQCDSLHRLANLSTPISGADAWHRLAYDYNPAGRFFPAYGGDGNVVATAAQHGYGPFGELLRATGPMAKANPFRFSTKYQDDETDLLYYGMRYLKTSTGGWLSKDPLGEKGGLNLYGFLSNDPIKHVDRLGLNEYPIYIHDPDSNPNEVTLHIGFVQDFYSWAADSWDRILLADISVSVRPGDDLLDLKSQIESRLRPGQCIRNIIFSGHGTRWGEFGIFEENDPYDQINLQYLRNSDSHQSQLVAFLKTRMCPGHCEATLKACNQARNDIGQQMMTILAAGLNADVIGYDDWYAIVGWGNRVTACPDGTIQVTGGIGIDYPLKRIDYKKGDKRADDPGRGHTVERPNFPVAFTLP